MIDELELEFDEHTEKGRHRRRRGGRKPQQAGKRKGGGGKTFFAFFLVLLLLGGLAGGAWYGIDKVQGLFAAPDYTGGGTGEVTVEIKEGQFASDIAVTLYEAGVVKSTKAFVEAAGNDSRSKNIQPGVYKLRKEMRAVDALALLLDLKNRIVKGVTIREGLTAIQTFKLLAEQTGIPVKDFQAAAKDPIALGVPDFWFKRSDGKKAITSIEGFLYPETYEFKPNATAEDILKQMVAQFNAVVEEIDFIKTVESGLSITPFEALVVASLAQAEAGVPKDLPNVARVAYNRVYKADMPLQFDVTANYWLEVQGKPTKHSGELLESELDDPKSPYNTESKLGLPGGPINSPGKAALEGAANPPDKPWLYFVAIDTDGNSAFATTLQEHENNIQKACRNGVPLC